MNERVVQLGPDQHLHGILSDVGSQARNTVVLLLNAGMIRAAGPHRLNVTIARKLAEQGISSLRFDTSGVGDSPPRHDDTPILTRAWQEPQWCLDDLQYLLGIDRFFAIGLCSGAYAAYQCALRDPRLAGIVMLNPIDLIDDARLAEAIRMQRYRGRSTRSWRAWRNLLTGRVNYKRLGAYLRSRLSPTSDSFDPVAALEPVRADLRTIKARGARVACVSAGKDDSAFVADCLHSETDDVIDDHLFLAEADAAEAVCHLSRHGRHRVFGRPSTCSPMMLRWICDVPPPMVAEKAFM